VLDDIARQYGPTIVAAVRQEYPNDLRHLMSGPGDRPVPREVHPAFYGCLDWHSAVEMHWALVRLLRLAPDAGPAGEIRAVLDEHLTPAAMRTEAAYFDTRKAFSRPYGWGWALTLGAELLGWDDPDAARWSAAVGELTAVLAGMLLDWLPRLTYPQRYGMHMNTAFGLARALPYARAQQDPALLDAITAAARGWFGRDTDYPAEWEPDGADFLSPALTEAVLMSDVLPAEEFSVWFDRFLPRLGAGEPAALLTPATVSDSTDGQIAHLNGLNLYRAYAFTRLVRTMAAGDPRIPLLRAAADEHASVSLPAVVGGHWMSEHWLAAYAVLLLTD
jgi:Protein of unknown function (DUF2891)